MADWEMEDGCQLLVRMCNQSEGETNLRESLGVHIPDVGINVPALTGESLRFHLSNWFPPPLVCVEVEVTECPLSPPTQGSIYGVVEEQHAGAGGKSLGANRKCEGKRISLGANCGLTSLGAAVKPGLMAE